MKRLVGDIAKNARERIRVELDEFGGRQLVSARIWFDDGSGKLRPSTKGLSLDIRHLPALAAALAEAEIIARQHDLITPEAGERR